MPLDEFLATAEALRPSGYRPVRFRPYADGAITRVAAVWTRDARNWRLASGLTAEEVRQQDEKNRTETFLPVDVAGYVTTADGPPAERYAALWAEDPGDDARLYLGVTGDELTAVQKPLTAANLIPRTLQALRSPDGRLRYSGVWGKSPSPGVVTAGYRDLFAGSYAEHQALLSDQVLVDVSVYPDRRYAGIWSTEARFEAATLDGLDPAEHLRRGRELAARGYRPVAWSVSRTAPEGPPVSASVWHRPLVPAEAKDRLAQRQARAAVALVRLGKAESVWPLLRHSADPSVRSFIVNWLNPLGADPHAGRGGARPDRSQPPRPSPAPGRQRRWTPCSSTPRPPSGGP